MSITINVSALPLVPVAEPVLTNEPSLANYGTDFNDNLVGGARPSDQKIPLATAPVIVPYDSNPVAWNKNPVDRTDVAVAIPDNSVLTNRNKLLKLLYIFMFKPSSYYHSDVNFFVTRTGGKISFVDELVPTIGPVGPGSPMGYGIPFEDVISENVDPALEYFFIYQTYSLLGAADLVVRCEVDCVGPGNELGEIKSKMHPRYTSIWDETDYFKTVWAQMLFGRTQLLYFGAYTNKGKGTDAKFDNISMKSFAEVAALAKMDTDVNYLPPLTKLASLLQWIRANIADGEIKTFAYSKDAQTLTLA